MACRPVMLMKTFEMFAGYGGGSFALKRLGVDFECVGFSEIDKSAIQCYRQNHMGPTNYGDCQFINPITIRDFDLLLGGFPCQAFSQAGKHLGESDTRGTLFYDIVRILEAKQPKFFLLENVKGLTYSNHRETFATILNELKRVGYVVKWNLMTSRDYGVPQSRSRVYFVGVRNDVKFDYSFPKPRPLTKFLKDIIDSDSEVVSIARRNKNRSKHQHQGLEYGTFPKEYHLVHNKDIGVSYTVKSALHECMVGHHLDGEYSNVRNLTASECFALMGFEKREINLNGISNTQQLKMAGNGWDINIISLILANLPL